MRTNILATAFALPDHDLLARIRFFASTEREATAELVAHLAALELRPSAYAKQGYGSLFAYCTDALRLSEDAAGNRITAARACRRFPVILDLLGSGELTLASVRMLRPHLTPENHEAVLEKARNGSKTDIEALVAKLAPRADLPASVRKLPVRHTQPVTPRLDLSDSVTARASCPAPAAEASPVPATASRSAQAGFAAEWARGTNEDPATLNHPPISEAAPPTRRGTVQASAPERYRVQFTIGEEGREQLQRLQRLLRREVPSGDPGAIFMRALALLLEKTERAKLGARREPRASKNPVSPAYENRIRPGADERGATAREAAAPSRYIPKVVKRAVWDRDRGQCAFVSSDGRRCSERVFLEFHHIQPYAMSGPATIANISLRCRRHNAFEAEVVFGPGAGIVRETHERYGT